MSETTTQESPATESPERVTEVAEIGLEQIVEMLDKLEADVTQAMSLHAPHAAQAFFQQFGDIRRGLVGMDLQAARAALNGGDTSLDNVADAVLTRVAQFFGECVATPNFCALSVDVKRNSLGQPQYLRMVPCDLVGGQPARRWPKD
jgi:hypothetical protein